MQLWALCREFEVLCMKDSESVDEYFARTLAIANNKTTQGERMKQTAIDEVYNHEIQLCCMLHRRIE